MKLEEIKDFHDNGQLKIHFYKDENGLIQGECKEYYNNGNLNVEYYFKNDKLHGIHKQYYYDGSLEYKMYYIEGKEVSKKEYYKSIINEIERS